jgi:molybdopterin-guanine dinucleotide biosynthesis protein A
MEVEGIVLAGGRSSRIGEDKSFLQYKGRSLVEWAIQVLSDLSVPIALVRNADQDFSSLDVSCWPDERPELGPLGGLYTGLRRSRARKLFVLPCDLPLMEPGLFPALDALLEVHQAVAPLDSSGRLHPLCGVYLRSCLSSVREMLDEGELRTQQLFQGGRLQSRTIASTIHGFPDRIFTNVNTVGDLQSLQ